MSDKELQSIKSFIETADAKKEAKAWGVARADYLIALDNLNKFDKQEKSLLSLKNKIEDKLVEVNNELAKQQFNRGKSCVEHSLWETAVDALEEATRLADEKEVAFLEEIKTWLDKARVGLRDTGVQRKVSPILARGDDFKRNCNYGEAILEYQAASELLVNLPKDNELVKHVRNQIISCRRSIIRPYLKRAYKAGYKRLYVKAATLLKRAMYLVAADDDIYREFIEQLVKKAESRLSNKEMNETEDSEGQENWEQAIKDYEEALDLYSSYTVSDPFAPAYNGANVYEDQFVEARRQLGRLYKARADRLRNNGKVEKAIHNYKEAIKLLPKTDRLFQEAFLEMKKLRIQVNVPEEK